MASASSYSRLALPYSCAWTLAFPRNLISSIRASVIASSVAAVVVVVVVVVAGVSVASSVDDEDEADEVDGAAVMCGNNCRNMRFFKLVSMLSRASRLFSASVVTMAPVVGESSN